MVVGGAVAGGVTVDVTAGVVADVAAAVVARAAVEGIVAVGGGAVGVALLSGAAAALDPALGVDGDTRAETVARWPWSAVVQADARAMTNPMTAASRRPRIGRRYLWPGATKP